MAAGLSWQCDDAQKAGFGEEPDAGGQVDDGGGEGEGDLDEEAPWRSGDRLRARVIDGGDGALLFAGWYDSELEVDCGFQVVADGSIRCLPRVPSVGEPFIGDFYLDAGCERPGRFIFRPGDLPPFLLGGDGATQDPLRCDPDARPPHDRLFRPVLIERPREVYSGTPGNCTVSGGLPPPDSGVEVVELQPVPFESLVGAVEEVDAHGEVSARGFRGDDGSLEVESLAGPDGKECDLFEPVAGSPVCVPAGTPVTSVLDLFADGACSEPLLVVEVDHQLCPDNVLGLVSEGTCTGARGGPGLPTRILEMSRFESGRVFKRAMPSNLCEAIVTSGSVNVRAMGSAVGDLPRLEVASVGTGRLRAHYGLSSGGVAARNPDVTDRSRRLPYWFEDTARGEVCVITDIGTGELRCLPASASAGEGPVYLDPACTEPALLSQLDGCLTHGASHLLEHEVITVDGESRAAIAAVLTPLPVEPSPVWYYRQENGCERVGAEEGAALPAVAVERTPIEAFVIVSERLE